MESEVEPLGGNAFGEDEEILIDSNCFDECLQISQLEFGLLFEHYLATARLQKLHNRIRLVVKSEGDCHDRFQLSSLIIRASFHLAIGSQQVEHELFIKTNLFWVVPDCLDVLIDLALEDMPSLKGPLRKDITAFTFERVGLYDQLVGFLEREHMMQSN